MVLPPKPRIKSRLRRSGVAIRQQVIVNRKIADLKLNPRNARKHPPKQLSQLAASIARFDITNPILIDAEDQVICGHGRVQACQLLGRAEIATLRIDHLRPAEIKAYAIADNKLAENATWDEQLLGEIFLELEFDLEAADIDLSLDITGFDAPKIDLLMKLSKEGAHDNGKDDVLPTVSSGVAVTQLNDFWLLGRHRVFCANSLEGSSYARLMGVQRAAMVITDPPYNVRINGHAGGKGRIKHREFAFASGDMTPLQYTTFLKEFCSHAAEFSVDGSLHFIFMDWRHMSELQAATSSIYSELKNVVVWVKDTPGMGSLYRSAHELVFVYKFGKAPHRNNIELGKHGRNRSNTWFYPGANSFARNTQEGNLLALHATPKPVALIADALFDCSVRGDVVLDPFLGSGTTVIAAEKTSRACYGMELDCLHVDTIVRRWQAWTGQAAVHQASGKTFAELEADAILQQHIAEE